MKKYLSNKEMAESFGSYDFRTTDMKRVCQAQRKLTLKEARDWFESLPIDPVRKMAFLVDFDIILGC